MKIQHFHSSTFAVGSTRSPIMVRIRQMDERGEWHHSVLRFMQVTLNLGYERVIVRV